METSRIKSNSHLCKLNEYHLKRVVKAEANHSISNNVNGSNFIYLTNITSGF